MKVLIASDSFKDALSAVEVCAAIERGVRRANPAARCVRFPLGDGGEGTSEILTWHTKGHWIKCMAHDPLFCPIEAGYGLAGDGRTAFIEMAQTAGLQLLQVSERNPLKTTTYGVGELILNALRRGATRLVLCIGGSATNDAGIGMAGALGFQFTTRDGILSPHQLTGENLARIQRIIPPAADAPIYRCLSDTLVLCDVTNPLFGEQGAAQTYAPQKGADDAAVAMLDAGLQHFAKVLAQHCGRDFAQVSGAGAAGGLGAGAMAFLGAILRSGIETVLDLTRFDVQLNGVDLVITGEGKIDRQTQQGKLISGVVRRAQPVPVIALCGALLATPEEIAQIGLQAAFSILNRPMSLETALSETAALLERTAFNVVKSANLYLRPTGA